MTFKIPITTDVGYMIYHNANAVFEQWADVFGQNVTYLDIALVDAYGNEVDLNGIEWSLLISIDCI